MNSIMKQLSPEKSETITEREDNFQENVRILILDDHPLCRKGLTQLIHSESSFQVVGEAETVEQGLRRVEETQPHVVIVDLSLRGESGLDFVKAMKNEHPDVKLLILSMHEEIFFAEQSLRAGATGYMTKKESLEHLIPALEHVAKGQFYLSDEMKEKIISWQFSRHEERSPMACLSQRELEVFRFIGQGRPTTEIAQNLQLSVKTIETYRSNIKQKLNLKSNLELLQQAVRWQKIS